MPLLDEDYLILSTIHSAKGQEWKSVFVLNVVDGCIPSDLGAGTTAEIEEERRLLYVAMTRAKDDLHLIVPQRFFTHGQNAKGDRHVYASRTRFIPEKLLGLFERTAWPLAPAGAAARAGAQGPRSISAPACAACGDRSPAASNPAIAICIWWEPQPWHLFCIAALMEACNDERLHRNLRAATLAVGVGVWGLRGNPHVTRRRRPKPCASSPLIPP